MSPFLLLSHNICLSCRVVLRRATVVLYRAILYYVILWAYYNDTFTKLLYCGR